MSVLFQVRGTSIDAYHAAGYAPGGLFFNSGATQPAVQADATSGVIGGSVINLSNASQSTGLCYIMRKNFPITPAVAILMRVVMKHTADGSNFPSNNQGLFCIGDTVGGLNDGVALYWKTTGKFNLSSKINYQINNQTADAPATVGLTTGAVHEFLLSWDGTSGSNKWKLYVDGVLSQQWTAGNGYGDAGVPSQRTLQMIGSLMIGVAPSASLSEFYLNELVIWDTTMDYSSGLTFGRTSFVSASALDGSVYTDPGIANVRSGTSYTQAGVAEVGTAVIPAASDVRQGTSVDAGTGSAYIPAAADVRFGTSVDATTGSAHIPASADVRHGTAVDATTGLAYIPVATDVRIGVNTDQTVGSAHIPGANDVRSGVLTDATTGDLAVPTASQVKTGVTFESNSGTTGTYDGSDRWTDPGASNVRSGTAYKANSTTNNETGSAHIPGAVDVRSGVATDATTGSLHVPSASDVRNAVAVDAGTGDLVVPAASAVEIGTTYDSNSSVTGTYTGADRWSDPGIANVLGGVQYQADSLTDNRTGSYQVPLASDVKIGVVFDGGATGTYDGSDRWTSPAPNQLLAGVHLKSNSQANNLTGTLTSTDPGVANVVKGVAYEINSVNKTGTLGVDNPPTHFNLGARIDDPRPAVRLAE